MSGILRTGAAPAMLRSRQVRRCPRGASPRAHDALESQRVARIHDRRPSVAMVVRHPSNVWRTTTWSIATQPASGKIDGSRDDAVRWPRRDRSPSWRATIGWQADRIQARTQPAPW